MNGCTQVKLFALSLALALVVLAACTGQEPPPPPDPAIALMLDRTVADVLRGDSVSVTVTLTRIGAATEPARLSLGGTVPSGVTPTFDPPELTGQQTTSTLSFVIEPQVPAATLELDVVVDVGALSTYEHLSVDIEGLTVVGRVEDMYGLPLIGARVLSQGKEARVDAGGEFTLTDLSVPYDLAVGSVSGSHLHVFEGLRAAAPHVVPMTLRDEPITNQRQVLEGEFGKAAPLGPGERIVICAEGLETVVYFCDRYEEGDVDYALGVTWLGKPNQAVTLHALAYLVDAEETTIGYRGYASFATTLQGSGTTVWNPELQPIGTAKFEVQAERGDGIDSGSLVLAAAWRLGEHLSVMVSGDLNEDSVTLLVPDVAGATESFDVFAVDGFESFRTSAAWLPGVVAPSVRLSLLDAPDITGPAEFETGVNYETEFSVSGMEGRAKTFAWIATDGTSIIALTTMRDTVTIPDAASLGLEAADLEGVEHMWEVYGAHHDDTDSATTDVREGAVAYGLVLDLALPALTEGRLVGSMGDWFTFGPPIL